ncbi:MAG: hypothetical protein AB3N19_02605 [Ruegeria sp.]
MTAFSRISFVAALLTAATLPMLTNAQDYQAKVLPLAQISLPADTNLRVHMRLDPAECKLSGHVEFRDVQGEFVRRSKDIQLSGSRQFLAVDFESEAYDQPEPVFAEFIVGGLEVASGKSCSFSASTQVLRTRGAEPQADIEDVAVGLATAVCFGLSAVTGGTSTAQFGGCEF